MAHRASAWRTVWRASMAAGLTALLAACNAGTGDAGARAPGPARQDKARQTCEPQVSLLPTRLATEQSSATAINDAGWVAGWVAEDVTRAGRAVLWRDGGLPIELGVRGVPYDINEEGAIAIQGTGSGRGAFAAYLWKDGTLHRLRGTQARPHVMVAALNDDGLVVGTVNRYDAFNDRAATWRDGELRVLRRPPGAPHGPYQAVDVNNRGLIVGIGWSGPHPDPFWWSGRRVGALSQGDSGRGYASGVDDHGRVVGFVDGRGEDDPGGPPLLWRSVHSEPAPFFKRSGGVGLHHSNGFVVGNSRLGSGRRRPFLSHLANGRMTWLPSPPAPEGFVVEGTVATGTASGRGPYAASGGITVAGDVYIRSGTESGSRAVLWTCAQNY